MDNILIQPIKVNPLNKAEIIITFIQKQWVTQGGWFMMPFHLASIRHHTNTDKISTIRIISALKQTEFRSYPCTKIHRTHTQMWTCKVQQAGKYSRAH